jgi:hypothetical protein
MIASCFASLCNRSACIDVDAAQTLCHRGVRSKRGIQHPYDHGMLFVRSHSYRNGPARMQLPLPRYVTKATCAPQLADKAAVAAVEFDPVESVFSIRLKTRTPRPTRQDATIAPGGSVTCASIH